jgi:hypothetical protein
VLDVLGRPMEHTNPIDSFGICTVAMEFYLPQMATGSVLTTRNTPHPLENRCYGDFIETPNGLAAISSRQTNQT